jgi:hypothetical protein
VHDTSAVSPVWVMCGIEIAPGRVVLLASKDLTQAELEEESTFASAWSITNNIRLGRRFILTTTMRTFVRIEASDWPAAFQMLFARWSPDDADQPIQVGHMSAIPAPRPDGHPHSQRS